MQCCPPPGEKPGKRDQVEAMFDAIAPRYDLINRVLSLGTDRGWRRAAVRALGRDFQGSILDVATGTGDMVFEALRLNPSRIVGVDISEKMLQLACAKCERSGAGSRVSFVNADAAALPFESGTFDAAMVAFGVRNFQDITLGLQEICRVLRPGGRLVVLDFSRPESGLIRWVYAGYSRYVLPQVGRLLSRVDGAYAYLPESIRAFPSSTSFLERMRAAGLVSLSVRPLTFGVVTLYVGHAPEGSG